MTEKKGAAFKAMEKVAALNADLLITFKLFCDIAQFFLSIVDALIADL